MFSYGLQVVFVVLGMHLAPYLALGVAEPGKNVGFTGPVSEEVKAAVFALSDVALAPMMSGTGSSLKIPEYIASGKIVVGTSIGLRGFEAFLRFPSVIVAEDIREALSQVLRKLDEYPEGFAVACAEAQEWVNTTHDWSVTARPLLDVLAAGRMGGG